VLNLAEYAGWQKAAKYKEEALQPSNISRHALP
jgi:hypothetical protein